MFVGLRVPFKKYWEFNLEPYVSFKNSPQKYYLQILVNNRNITQEGITERIM